MEEIKKIFKKHKIFLHDFYGNTEEALQLDQFTAAVQEATASLKEELESVKNSDSLRKSAIDNHWEPALNQSKQKISELEREKDIAYKTCDRLADEKIMLKGDLIKHTDFLAQVFNAIEHEEHIDQVHPLYKELLTFLEHK